MEAIKATFVEGVTDYAVTFADGSVKHIQPVKGVSFTQYKNAVKHTHPEYDFTPVIMTPPTEAVHPHKEELAKAFAVDEVSFDRPVLTPEHQQEVSNELLASIDREDLTPEDAKLFDIENKVGEEIYNALRFDKQPPFSSNVDEVTGEIKTDPQPIINNPLKQETMDNQAQAQEPTVETPKVSFGHKVGWVGKVGVATTVRGMTIPLGVTLQSASDVLGFAAKQVRNFEGWSVDKLKISDKSRDDIQARIAYRNTHIEQVGLNIITAPIVVPINLYQLFKGARIAAKEQASQVQPQTA